MLLDIIRLNVINFILSCHILVNDSFLFGHNCLKGKLQQLFLTFSFFVDFTLIFILCQRKLLTFYKYAPEIHLYENRTKHRQLIEKIPWTIYYSKILLDIETFLDGVFYGVLDGFIGCWFLNFSNQLMLFWMIFVQTDFRYIFMKG